MYPGSTGEKLLHGAPCAVAIVPRSYDEQPVGRVGVAYDGSDEAKAALDSAVALAEAFGAELELIGVAPSDWYTGPALAGGIERRRAARGDRAGHARQRLESAAASIAHPRPRRSCARATRPTSWPSAAPRLDLLVTGSRGYGPLRSVITGGVSGRVIRSASCPVIVVPRGAEPALQVAA